MKSMDYLTFFDLLYNFLLIVFGKGKIFDQYDDNSNYDDTWNISPIYCRMSDWILW